MRNKGDLLELRNPVSCFMVESYDFKRYGLCLIDTERQKIDSIMYAGESKYDGYDQYLLCIITHDEVNTVCGFIPNHLFL